MLQGYFVMVTAAKASPMSSYYIYFICTERRRGGSRNHCFGNISLEADAMIPHAHPSRIHRAEGLRMSSYRDYCYLA